MLVSIQMSSVFKTKDNLFVQSGSWETVSEPKGTIIKTLHIPGRQGATPLDVYITENGTLFSNFKKKWSLSSLWLVCFQRVTKQLKMCDVIWILDGVPVLQAIDRAQVELICRSISCHVYMCGLDPLPWDKFKKDAKQYGWTQEDWHHLLSEDSEEDSEEDTKEDSDWIPEDWEEEDDDEDSDED